MRALQSWCEFGNPFSFSVTNARACVLPVVSGRREDPAVREHRGALQEPLLRQVGALNEARGVRHEVLGVALERQFTLPLKIARTSKKQIYRVPENIHERLLRQFSFYGKEHKVH